MVRNALSLPLAALAICAGSVAVAQTATPSDPSQVRRLSPEEKERILANSDERTADAALNAALGGGRREDVPGNGSGVHGEVGFTVGTGGTAGVYGTALVPLGDRGAAIFSFEDFRSDTPVRRRR